MKIFSNLIILFFLICVSRFEILAQSIPTTNCLNMDLKGEWKIHDGLQMFSVQGGCALLALKLKPEDSEGKDVVLSPDGKEKNSLENALPFFNKAFGDKIGIHSATAVSKFGSDSQGDFLKIDIKGNATLVDANQKFDFTMQIIVTQKKVTSCTDNCNGLILYKNLKVWIGRIRITKAYSGDVNSVKKNLSSILKAPKGILEDFYFVKTIKPWEEKKIPACRLTCGRLNRLIEMPDDFKGLLVNKDDAGKSLKDLGCAYTSFNFGPLHERPEIKPNEKYFFISPDPPPRSSRGHFFGPILYHRQVKLSTAAGYSVYCGLHTVPAPATPSGGATK